MTQTGAANLDWLAIWQQMYDAERAQAERIPPPDPARVADCWVGQAARFAAAAARNPQPDAFMQFLLPRLGREQTVLDIGAGSGRYVPLLAATAGHVIALEPSAAMRAELEQRLVTSVNPTDRARVTIDPRGWPTTAPPACEVAIAAHVVYGIREIGPFLAGINACASQACYLLIGVRHPTAAIMPFWHAIHGEPRLPLPAALECLPVLYQLGIHAHLTPLPVTRRIEYLDREEALVDLRWRLRLNPEPASDTRLLAAIDTLLTRDDQGRLWSPDPPAPAAVIWWEK